MWRLLAVLVLVGCASEGRELAAWTLEVPGEPAAPLTLPDSLQDAMSLRSTPFVLRRTVELAPDERGWPLTLAFDCFHGPLALAVDGVELVDAGDDAVGEHRFVIPPQQAPRIELVVHARYDWAAYAGDGFRFTPRLAVGAHTRPGAAATFNRAIGIASIAAMLLLGAIFTLMYLLDRERRENGVGAFVVLSALPMIFCWQFGALLAFDLAAATVVGALVCVVALALLAFIHWSFDLGDPPRALRYALLASAAANLANLVSLRATALVDLLTMPVIFATNIFILVKLIRLSRGPRREARILLVGWIVALSMYLCEFAVPNATGLRPFGGVHLMSLTLVITGLSIGLVLARQHVARREELVRTAGELRHQVAARSRELAVAIAKLAQPFEAERVIDGRYRVVRHLGAGGMGTVHEVERISDGRRLALKTLRTSVDAATAARFAREAEIAAALDHRNLVPVIDVGLDGGTLFLVMPLVTGGSLAGARDRFGDAAWARPLLGQIASGLAALHERGIVHRDLKPGNVLVDDGTARIADFGLAGVISDDSLVAATLEPGQSPLTRAGELFGTPRYMAPELAAGASNASPASDIFAFGVMACELLTGKPPFERPVVHDGTVPEPALDGLASPLRELVARCLDASPERRPAASDLRF